MNYKQKINQWETQKAISKVEVIFEKEFSKKMSLTKVTGPLFVDPKTGFNDNLSGVETPVSFEYKKTKLEIVHSLAKWKRFALWEFNIPRGEGLFVRMNAIRPNESSLSKYHSLHVEQYDWEKTIIKEDRSLEFLFQEVNKIYLALVESKKAINKLYPSLELELKEKITFISSQELKNIYPNKDPEEREREFAKKNKSIFVYGIGHQLSDQKPHGLRAPDYDDWNINGDLIIWDEVNQDALEISSMGIRVDAKSLKEQMKIANVSMNSDFHQSVLNDRIPLSIGGGIGRTRVNMLLLEKGHIGEVQATYWTKKQIQEAKEKGWKLIK